MKHSPNHSLRRMAMAAILLLCAATGYNAAATVYVSNLDNFWPTGFVGDIHALFQDKGASYKSDTARFTTGSGSSFTLNAITLEFYPRNNMQQWQGLNIQLFQDNGNVLLGNLGNAVLNPKPTQWPITTIFVDFSPLTPIILNPSSAYSVVVGIGSSPGAALMFTTLGYTANSGWTMGATTSAETTPDSRHLKLAVDATAVPEPSTAALLMGGIVLIIRRRFFSSSRFQESACSVGISRQ